MRNSRHHPLIIQHARQRLAEQQQRYEGGDGFALLAAIRICANHDLVMPEWVAKGYIRRYDSVLNCRVGSWDKAFGEPYPGRHLHKLRQRREKRFAVWNRISSLRAGPSPPPIDKGLFENVGADLGIGSRTCSELYYEAKRLLEAAGSNLHKIGKFSGNTTKRK